MGFGTKQGFPLPGPTPAMSATATTLIGQGISLTQTNPTVATTVS